MNSLLVQSTKHGCNWRRIIITVSVTAGLLIKLVLCPEPRALPATMALQGNYSMGSQDDWWRYSLNTNLTLCSLIPNNPTRLSLNRAPSPWHVFHGGFQKKTSSQVPEPRANGRILACLWGPRAGAQAGASCAHTDPKQRVLGCDSCSWLWNKHQAWRDYDRFYLYYETDFTSYMRQKMSVSQRDGNPFAGPELPTEPSSGLLLGVRLMEHLLCSVAGPQHMTRKKKVCIWQSDFSLGKNKLLFFLSSQKQFSFFFFQISNYHK